jgi:hypothetical protein
MIVLQSQSLSVAARGTTLARHGFFCGLAPWREIPFLRVSLWLSCKNSVCSPSQKIKPIRPKSNRFLKIQPNSTLELGCATTQQALIENSGPRPPASDFWTPSVGECRPVSPSVGPSPLPYLSRKEDEMASTVKGTSNLRPNESNLIQPSPTHFDKKMRAHPHLLSQNPARAAHFLQAHANLCKPVQVCASPCKPPPPRGYFLPTLCSLCLCG